MLVIKPIESPHDLHNLKNDYFAQATSPLDGMWHFGFAPISNHFGFAEDNKLVGYCCINDEGYMLQFYLAPTAKTPPIDVFSTLLRKANSQYNMGTGEGNIGQIKGAFVSTAEPHYLSLCLDCLQISNVNALMYELNPAGKVDTLEPLKMVRAQSAQLKSYVEFAVGAIGAPEQWLTMYYDNLIQRQELWGYWQEDKLVATGECRLSGEQQADIADLGVIVGITERGKGVGTRVLRHVMSVADGRGLKPICSTERDNIGAQKAIAHAGFIATNRIVQFECKNR